VSYLVDTNIFSESAKPKPDPQVMTWLKKHESEIYISTITVGEIRRGIERLPWGKRKTQLQVWLRSLCDCMQGRILSFNLSTAHIWGQLKAGWEAEKIVVPSLDSQIAAIAHRHSLVLVTRNTDDFEKTGLRLLNPFKEEVSGIE